MAKPAKIWCSGSPSRADSKPCGRKVRLLVISRLGTALHYCGRHRHHADSPEFVSLPLQYRRELE